MIIYLDDTCYEGSPSEIIDQLWEQCFIKDEFRSTEDCIEYMRVSFERMTDLPCLLPRGNLDTQARALFEHLASIDALEILEDS